MSLRYRIAITIFVLEAAMMFFVLRTTLSSSLDDTTKQLAYSERHIVDLVSDLSRPALLTEDYGGLQSSLTRTAQHARIVRVVVFDHHGTAVAASRPADIGSTTSILADSGTNHWIRQDITTAAGVLGTVAAEFSNAEVVAASDRVTRLGLIIALAGMSLIAIVGVVIGVLLTRRLRRLSETANNLARGDLAARTSVTGSDELGQLGDTLNEMAERVQADQAELSEREDTMRALYNLTASRTLSTADRLRRILDMGCEQFGLEVGFIARLDDEDCVIEYVGGPGPGRPEVGARFALSEMFCAKAFAAEETVVQARAEGEDGPRAYIATSLQVADGTYGALSFSSSRPHEGEFSASVRQLIELMARWVASQLERSELQARLMVSDRLASAGMLAAGVAHEINNPLTYVYANLQLMSRRGTVGGPPQGALVEQSIEGVERIRNVVSDLAHLGRFSAAEPTRVDVCEVLESSIRMAWHEIKYRAEMQRELEDGLFIDGDPSRLGQLFLNLIVNAAQAIDVGDKQHNWIRVTAAAEGASIVVTVTDSGRGIDEGMLPHVFDPFVTSRKGTGTGLGLYLCQQIVTSMGGRLDITSTHGEGTTARVTLPAATSRPESVAAFGAGAAAGAPAPARVLIVDDEELIRSSLALALDRHQVETVGSANEAIRLLRERDFDVVFCDLIMPQSTGMDLYAFVAEHRPQLAQRMVFMSGDAFTESARTFVEQKSVVLLQKPFHFDRLEELIAEIGTSRD